MTLIDKLTEALRTVMAYRRGEGQFNFSRLPAEQRANEAFDAWHRVEDVISAALAEAERVKVEAPPMGTVERVARVAEPDVWAAIDDVGISPSDRSRWREASMTRASMWVAAYRAALEEQGMVVVPGELLDDKPLSDDQLRRLVSLAMQHGWKSE